MFQPTSFGIFKFRNLSKFGQTSDMRAICLRQGACPPDMSDFGRGGMSRYLPSFFPAMSIHGGLSYTGPCLQGVKLFIGLKCSFSLDIYLHSRGRKGRECKFQNKAHRTLDLRKTLSPVHGLGWASVTGIRKRDFSMSSKRLVPSLLLLCIRGSAHARVCPIFAECLSFLPSFPW